jgi:3-oxoacyl-[acyl-carrier protein] reductase
MAADVSRPGDVQRLADAAAKLWNGVDTLVANAGVLGPQGAADKVDWQAWSDTVAINLYGTVLCCRCFLPLLKRSTRGSVILLSGGGATKPMPFLSAYAASKAAVVRFGETLAEELHDFHIDVNMIAPGALNTRMLEEGLEAGPEGVGAAYYRTLLKQKAEGGASLERAARLCVYLASDQSAGITGKLISAVWDPWPDLDGHRQDLVNSDIYTLRRIVPKDRGKDWG